MEETKSQFTFSHTLASQNQNNPRFFNLIEEEKTINIESDTQNKSEIYPEYETASKYLDEIREKIKQENSS